MLLLLLLGEQVQIKSINFIWWHSLVGYKKWRLIFQRRNSFGSTLSWSIWLWMSKIQVKMEFLFHFDFILLCIQNTKHSWYRSILMGSHYATKQFDNKHFNECVAVSHSLWFACISVNWSDYNETSRTNAHKRSQPLNEPDDIVYIWAIKHASPNQIKNTTPNSKPREWKVLNVWDDHASWMATSFCQINQLCESRTNLICGKFIYHKISSYFDGTMETHDVKEKMVWFLLALHWAT